MKKIKSEVDLSKVKVVASDVKTKYLIIDWHGEFHQMACEPYFSVYSGEYCVLVWDTPIEP